MELVNGKATLEPRLLLFAEDIFSVSCRLLDLVSELPPQEETGVQPVSSQQGFPGGQPSSSSELSPGAWGGGDGKGAAARQVSPGRPRVWLHEAVRSQHPAQREAQCSAAQHVLLQLQRFNAQETICALYVWHDSLAEMVVMDSEYPSQGAVALPEKVLDEFSKQVDKTEWPVGSLATILVGHLRRSQNLGETDPMSKAWVELEATKIVLHNTTGPLLGRGEKLDGLVSKPEVLETV